MPKGTVLVAEQVFVLKGLGRVGRRWWGGVWWGIWEEKRRGAALLAGYFVGGAVYPPSSGIIRGWMLSARHAREVLGIVSILTEYGVPRDVRSCGCRCCGDFESFFAYGAGFARVDWCILDGARFRTRDGFALRGWSLAGDQRWGWGGGSVAGGEVDVGGADGGRRGVDDLFDGGDILAAAESLLHGQLRLDELDEFIEFRVLEKGK